MQNTVKNIAGQPEDFNQQDILFKIVWIQSKYLLQIPGHQDGCESLSRRPTQRELQLQFSPENFTFFEQVFLVGRWHTCQFSPEILLFLSKFSWWGGGIPAKSLQFRLVKDSADFKTGKTLDGDYHYYYAHHRSMLDHLLSEQCSVLLKTMIMLIIDTSVALSRYS